MCEMNTTTATMSMSLYQRHGLLLHCQRLSLVEICENRHKSCLPTTLTPKQRPQRLTLTIVSTFNSSISPFEPPKI
ncbi:hypothetical protein GBAR_LOCUS24714 [Geodia barretti]|uniref:Uncharacterized protein n=1 Tax=Geodia barretti TaxID=519541 RepID=A0AA35TCS8_GEOBA|nr:hypothetical protein GBAR_LOCUS24714 [Geodia barretti]